MRVVNQLSSKALSIVDLWFVEEMTIITFTGFVHSFQTNLCYKAFCSHSAYSHQYFLNSFVQWVYDG